MHVPDTRLPLASQEESDVVSVLGPDLRRRLEIVLSMRGATSLAAVLDVRLHVDPLAGAAGILREERALGMLRLQLEIV